MVIINDYNRFKSILVNLLTNAVKFTERGEVVIKLNIHKSDSNILEVIVSDTGIGMPKDKLTQLFKLFEIMDQNDEKLTKQTYGIGFGLSISL